MKILSRRNTIVIVSLLVFAVVLVAGWLVVTERVVLSGVTNIQSETKEAGTTDCLQSTKLSQNNSECLFVGCNGFF